MKKLSLLMAVLLLLLSLGACGGGGERTSDENGLRTDLNLRSINAIQTIDPSDTRTEQNMVVLEQVYQGLYKLDENKGGYELCLAKSVDISADGLVCTFTLQDNVKFQNGETMKASDVVFSYERFMDNTKFDAYTNMLKSVEALNDNTVVITLTKPYSPIAHTFHTIKILSEKEVTSQGGEFGTKVACAGTGPYYFEEYHPSIKWVLKAFPDYWGGEPPIKTVNYIPITDDAAALIAFENGELDWLNAPMSDWNSIVDSGKYNTEIIPGNWTQVVEINYMANEALANDKVREAIAHAINKDAMNKATFEGYGTPTNYFEPEQYVVATPKDGFATYDYDPELSKKLLAEAGYPNGVDVGEILTYGIHDKSSQVLQSNLADVGITASVSVLEIGLAIDRMNVQKYDICVLADMGNYDFNNFRQQVSSESKGMYIVKFQGDKFPWQHYDELIDKGAALTDVDERIAVYTQLYDEIMRTCTILPTLHSPVANVWAKGLNVVNVPTFYDVSKWSWEKTN
jgi:peptide/nickel transport system substrate-binding protein